jgi:hypothetical protein
MFCPECNAIMEEIRSVPAPYPAEDSVIDGFECPRCHCYDERLRTLQPSFGLHTTVADDSSKV